MASSFGGFFRHSHAFSPPRSPPASSSHALVDTLEGVRIACAQLTQEPRIVVDIEGINLSRTGKVCLVQVATRDSVFIFDICALGIAAFDAGLRWVLECPQIMKLFYDVRGDCDALWHQFRVRALPLMDVQVVYVAASRMQSEYLPGLHRVLDSSRWIPAEKRQRMSQLKELGRNLFAPERGGAYSVWLERPLKAELLEYACQDVSLLMRVYDVAMDRIENKYTREYLILVSQHRAQTAIMSETVATELAKRDFTLDQEESHHHHHHHSPHQHHLQQQQQQQQQRFQHPHHQHQHAPHFQPRHPLHSPQQHHHHHHHHPLSPPSSPPTHTIAAAPFPSPTRNNNSGNSSRYHPHNPHAHHNHSSNSHHHHHHHQSASSHQVLLSFGLALSTAKTPSNATKGLRITPFHEHIAATNATLDTSVNSDDNTTSSSLTSAEEEDHHGKDESIGTASGSEHDAIASTSSTARGGDSSPSPPLFELSENGESEICAGKDRDIEFPSPSDKVVRGGGGRSARTAKRRSRR